MSEAAPCARLQAFSGRFAGQQLIEFFSQELEDKKTDERRDAGNVEVAFGDDVPQSEGERLAVAVGGRELPHQQVGVKQEDDEAHHYDCASQYVRLAGSFRLVGGHSFIVQKCEEIDLKKGIRERLQPWLLFGLLVLAGAVRWMVTEARPDSESTLASLTLGCGWAALVSLMLLVRGPAQAMVRRSWLGLLAGALLFAGPVAGLLLHVHEFNATSLTMALTLTPVAVGITSAAVGGGEMGGAAGRIWPGLAALGGLLLLLAEPSLSNPRADLALFLAPTLTGVGAALLCLRGSSGWRATTGLFGATALFAVVLLVESVASGVRPRVSLLAVACDGVMALLSVYALLRVGATRWSAQFALLPLLIVLEGIAMVRPVFTARWVVGLSLLALASIYLLLPPGDDSEAGATVVPPR
jgi:hypothetical protein